MRPSLNRAFTAPAGFGRGFAAILFLAGSIAILPKEGRSQTIACSEVIGDMTAQQKMIGIFRSLDYQIREHFLIEANAILSTYGGWNSIERGNDATNATKLRDTTTNFELQASVARRDIIRNKEVTPEELQIMNGAIEIFLELIEAGDRIAKAIDDGRVDDANQMYFETARPNYLKVHGDLYTLIAKAEKRVASLARIPCS